MLNKKLYRLMLMVGLQVVSINAFSALPATSIDNEGAGAGHTYVASNNSVQQLLSVLGGAIHKPIIVSNEAAKKRVTGNFDISQPDALLASLASRIGLTWYSDGSSIYVYDVSEMQSRVVKLSFAPFSRLIEHLKTSGLYDVRFPVRSSDNAGGFYVSGPPIYVQLVAAAANDIDASYSRPGSGKTTIRVIKLRSSFVTDRTYTQRDQPVTIPGVASVLNQLLNSSSYKVNTHGGARITLDTDTKHALEAASASETGNFPPLPSFASASSSVSGSRDSQGTDNLGEDNKISIVGYSDTNSLLIQGSEKQVSFVEDLVRAIDIDKRQIQMSLWIIDVAKNNVDQLGVKWQGAAKFGNTGVSLNSTSLTPEGSMHFLADISALVDKGSAQVVSSPEILTQENVPALFDNNSTFYTPLVGERNSSLEKVTYGTMISVLPRISQYQKEIEMILNIQDGSLSLDSEGQTEEVGKLPLVNNTQISTEARVPVGYSLLVGGYTRKQDTQHELGIPLLMDIPVLGRLFDYSYVSHKDLVRLFLIQPRLLNHGDTWQGQDNSNPVLGHSKTGDNVTLDSTVSMLHNKLVQP